MTRLTVTRHGRQRLDQRGLRDGDLDLIQLFGTEVRDGYLLRQDDLQAAVKLLKSSLKRLEKLAGKRIVCRDGKLVTAFHATDRQCQKLLRDLG
jgi:hypothetical protein